MQLPACALMTLLARKSQIHYAKGMHSYFELTFARGKLNIYSTSLVQKVNSRYEWIVWPDIAEPIDGSTLFRQLKWYLVI